MPSSVVGIEDQHRGARRPDRCEGSSLPGVAHHQVGAQGHHGLGVHLEVAHLGDRPPRPGSRRVSSHPPPGRPAPRANSVSVLAGAVDTIRMGLAGMVTLVPLSSVTVAGKVLLGRGGSVAAVVVVSSPASDPHPAESAAASSTAARQDEEQQGRASSRGATSHADLRRWRRASVHTDSFRFDLWSRPARWWRAGWLLPGRTMPGRTESAPRDSRGGVRSLRGERLLLLCSRYLTPVVSVRGRCDSPRSLGYSGGTVPASHRLPSRLRLPEPDCRGTMLAEQTVASPASSTGGDARRPPGGRHG